MFWDLVSLMPEAIHAVIWAMSDWAIPRSLRIMEGFGGHTFKLVNAEGGVHFVKFHWWPRLGDGIAGLGRKRQVAGCAFQSACETAMVAQKTPHSIRFLGLEHAVRKRPAALLRNHSVRCALVSMSLSDDPPPSHFMDGACSASHRH